MKAKKENKVYRINTEQEKQRYLKDGFDIYDDEGNLQEYSPKKKIAYSEYIKAVKEIEGLQIIVSNQNAEIDLLNKENGRLKANVAQEPEKKAINKKAGE